MGLAVWLDDVQLPISLPVTCESGIVRAEGIDDTDPIEECEGAAWLPVSIGDHTVSVSLLAGQGEFGDGDTSSFRVVPWTHVNDFGFESASQVSGDDGLSAEVGNQGGNRRTIVLSTVSGNVMHLIYQVRAWQKWCRDDFEFVAVLNHNPARSGRFRITNFNPEGVRTVCKKLGLRLVEVTFDVGGVENHQVLLEWVWHSLVLPFYAGSHVYVAVTESDVFPIDYFSIASFLEDGQCALGGKRLGSRDKDRYVHPGFSYFAMHQMPHPDRWCFVGLIISLEGQEKLLDTGGCAYLYLSRFQTSDNQIPEITISPRHVSPGEAEGVRAFYKGWAGKVDKIDPIGFSSTMAQSPAYRDFDIEPPQDDSPQAIKACWLGDHDHEEAALALLPLDCANFSQAPLRTAIQESFCTQEPQGTIVLFEGGQPVGGPFVHVGCGSGWCGAYDSVALQISKLARADTFLQYVQVRYGCECVHCEVAQELRSVGLEIPSQSLLGHDGAC